MAIVALTGGWHAAGADPAPVMTSAAPPIGVVGNGYLHQFTARTTPDPVFSVTNGGLPPGVVLSALGFLTGVPIAAGTFGPTTVCGSNLVAPPACQTFTIVIARRIAAMLAAPSPGGTLGIPVREVATLVGAFLPTGSVTFRLFGDPACTLQVFSSTAVVTVPGVAVSDDFTPRAPATYRWTAAYSGDANNQPVSTPCEPTNAVTIAGPAPAPASSTTTTSTMTASTMTASTTSASTSTSSTATSTTSTAASSTTSTTSTTVPTTVPTGTTTSTTATSTSTTSSTPTTLAHPSTTTTAPADLLSSAADSLRQVLQVLRLWG